MSQILGQYESLMRAFVAGDMSADDFAYRYFTLWGDYLRYEKSPEFRRSRLTQAIGTVFIETDFYDPEPSQLGEIDEAELRRRVANELRLIDEARS